MFHSSNPSLFGRPSSVVKEMRALESAVTALREVGGSLRRGVVPVRGRRAHRALMCLSAHLAAYLDAEEGSGYLGAIASQSADLQSRVSALEGAHERLRHTVSSAAERASTLRNAEAPELGRCLAGIVHDLEEHDETERILLQDFFVRYEPEESGEPH
jgi:hypothetical protein